MSVYLVQCLCPARHCIMATAVESESIQECRDAETLLLAAIDAGIANTLVDPWCGLCRAPREQWHTETGKTIWATMAEATPHLRAEEAAQIATAQQLKQSRN